MTRQRESHLFIDVLDMRLWSRSLGTARQLIVAFTETLLLRKSSQDSERGLRLWLPNKITSCLVSLAALFSRQRGPSYGEQRWGPLYRRFEKWFRRSTWLSWHRRNGWTSGVLGGRRVLWSLRQSSSHGLYHKNSLNVTLRFELPYSSKKTPEHKRKCGDLRSQIRPRTNLYL